MRVAAPRAVIYIALRTASRREVQQLADAATRLSDTLPAGEALHQWMRLFVDYIATKKLISSALGAVVGGVSELYMASGLLIIGAELLHLNQETWWDRSKLVPYGETVGDWLRGMVGERGEPWSKLERLTGVKVRPR